MCVIISPVGLPFCSNPPSKERNLNRFITSLFQIRTNFTFGAEPFDCVQKKQTCYDNDHDFPNTNPFNFHGQVLLPIVSVYL